jgi:hypothetical protein
MFTTNKIFELGYGQIYNGKAHISNTCIYSFTYSTCYSSFIFFFFFFFLFPFPFPPFLPLGLSAFDIDEFRYFNSPIGLSAINSGYLTNVWSTPILYYDFSQLSGGNLYDTLNSGSRNWPITSGSSVLTIHSPSPSQNSVSYGSLVTSGNNKNQLDMSSSAIGTSDTGFTHCQWIRIAALTLANLNTVNAIYSIFGIGSVGACVR